MTPTTKYWLRADWLWMGLLPMVTLSLVDTLRGDPQRVVVWVVVCGVLGAFFSALRFLTRVGRLYDDPSANCPNVTVTPGEDAQHA